MATLGRQAPFAALLRQYRATAGLSQEDLAERAGLSRRGISDLERGERLSPHPVTVRRIADALNLGPTERAALLASAHPAKSVAVDELPALPPPPAAPLTSFIGRGRELAELKRLLGSARLLTLTGAGGIGKTRLALEIAANVQQDFAEGVGLVELAPLADPALVTHTVAASLGVHEQPHRSILDNLIDALRPRQVLLVLDNCEHLVQACAELADGLLRACPGLRILATSREPLGIGGETAWRVPSLSLPAPSSPSTAESLSESEAARLFVERAQAALQGFRVTERSARSIADLCHRLDGIALALELAAAWVPVLSVEQIVERLGDTLRLLVTGSRVAPLRQQTLRATLDWSYGLLSEPEQRLFDRLSVFAGGFPLTGAEMVCGGDVLPREAVVGLLGQLVRKSLVQAEPAAGGSIRYRLLETVRQYARERLVESTAADTVQRRHAVHFLELAERGEEALRGPDQEIWLDRLEREHDNMRAALAWAGAADAAELGLRLAGALSRFWAIRGHLREGLGWLDTVSALSAGPSSARARMLNGSGWLALLQGDLTRARSDLQANLALVRELHDTRGIAETLQNVGRVSLDDGDVGSARACFTESLALSRALGYRWGIAFNLSGLAQAALLDGEIAKAGSLFGQALAVFRILDSPRHVAVTLSNLAAATLAQGNPGQARALYAEALELTAAEQDRTGLAHILVGLAGLARAQEELERTQTLLGAAAGLRAANGYPLSASDHAWPEATLATLQPGLAADISGAAWREGRGWSYDRALVEAVDAARSGALPVVPASRGQPAAPIAARGKGRRGLARGSQQADEP